MYVPSIIIITTSTFIWQLKEGTIVQVWKSPGFTDTLSRVTKLGYKALLSTPWYLNYPRNPYLELWQLQYLVDPHNFEGGYCWCLKEKNKWPLIMG